MKERVLAFLDTHLPGRRSISTGTDGEGSGLPFDVLEIIDQPTKGAVTYATIGLSEVPLRYPDGETIRQELLFCTYRRFVTADILPLMFFLGDDVRSRGGAIEAGEVLDLGEPVVGTYPATAIFFYNPIYFPEALAMMPGQPPVVFVWMIPITNAEAEWVASEGAGRFNDLLLERDPDLMDLQRSSTVG